MVKTNTFNGIPLPSIAVMDKSWKLPNDKGVWI